jgi:hypothetical protein
MNNHIDCRSYEYMKPYLKRYYETHGEKIRTKLQQKITCECGAVIKLASQWNHLNTQKHKKRLFELTFLNISI